MQYLVQHSSLLLINSGFKNLSKNVNKYVLHFILIIFKRLPIAELLLFIYH